MVSKEREKASFVVHKDADVMARAFNRLSASVVPHGAATVVIFHRPGFGVHPKVAVIGGAVSSDVLVGHSDGTDLIIISKNFEVALSRQTLFAHDLRECGESEWMRLVSLAVCHTFY